MWWPCQAWDRPYVAFHGLHAAAPAPGLQLGVQDRCGGDSFVPPRAQVGLVPVELAFPAGGPGQQLAGAGGGRVPVHGPAAQGQDHADRSQVLVPQRIEPGIRPRQLTDAQVNARQAGTRFAGSAEFRAAIADAPAGQRDLLQRACDWAESLERDDLALLAVLYRL
jgi:hypothetical protein